MNNGIKPTRLWHLTGKKHYRSVIKDKMEANPPFDQQERHKLFPFIGVVLASAFGIAASFGKFTKQRPTTTIIRGTCDSGSKQAAKPKCTPPKEPCPPVKDPPMKPCNKEE